MPDILLGMQIDPMAEWTRLTQLYGEMGDLELRELDPRDLTEVAQQVLRDELRKRGLKPHLRGLATPDDFVANLLTTLFALLAAGQLAWPALRGPWLAEAILLLVYLPLGKIRHCFFFFPTRSHLGAFFGRRGTFPPGGGSHA